MPTLKNTNPVGEVYDVSLGRTIGAGEEFDVTLEQAGRAPKPPKYDDDGNVTDPGDVGGGLLSQVGNYELVNEKKKG